MTAKNHTASKPSKEEHEALKLFLSQWVKDRRVFFKPNADEREMMRSYRQIWFEIIREKQFVPIFFTIYLAESYQSSFIQIIENFARRLSRIQGTFLQCAAAEIQLRDMIDYVSTLAEGHFLEQAARANPQSFDTCCRIAAAHLAANVEMRPGLAEFAALALTGELPRPKSGGRMKKTENLRYLFIQNMISICISKGFKASKNYEAEHHYSACDIVAEVLVEQGLKPSTYAKVKDVWERRARQKPVQVGQPTFEKPKQAHD